MQSSSIKLPITAMIVGFNESHMLNDCLQSVAFCDEIYYTDLGSYDNSISIAKKFTNNILQREKVPSCEMIQAEVINYTKNDWVIFIDPDEIIDAELQKQLINQFDSITNHKNIGAVKVPWRFYFRKKRLKGTVWGGSNSKYLLVNKQRFSFEPIVHYGRKLKDGFESIEIEETNENNVLHHYWMNSFSIFFKKHFRYLKNEGIDNYNNGLRTGKKAILISPMKEFYVSFIFKNGYKDGIIGFFLSLFWSFYKTYILVSLYNIQQKNKRAVTTAKSRSLEFGS